MSVATQISRIQQDRNTIRTKLVELGMAQNTDDLDKLAIAIDGLENRGAVSATVQERDTTTAAARCPLCPAAGATPCNPRR